MLCQAAMFCAPGVRAQTAWLNTRPNMSFFKQTQVVELLDPSQASELRVIVLQWQHFTRTSVKDL